MLITRSKGHVQEPLTKSQYLVCCCVDMGGDMCFICHAAQQDHSVEMSCVFMGESSLQHITTLQILVTIGIVIVRGKMLHQKHESYKYVVPLKNLVDQIITRREKNVTKMVHFRKKCPGIKQKKTYFPLLLPSTTLLLKYKPVELKRL